MSGTRFNSKDKYTIEYMKILYFLFNYINFDKYVFYV